MATRFYFPRTGAAATSPAYDAAWSDTDSALRRSCGIAKTGTLTLALVGGNATVGAANVLLVQYIGPPLTAQSISGSLRGQFVCGEYDSEVNACAQLVVRVVSGDGAAVRGTLVAAHANALSSEWPLDTAPRNRKFPMGAISPVTVSAVVAQDGDRLVFEIGAKVENNDAEQIELVVGDAQGTDLPEDETSQATAGDPWIELSTTLSFQAQAAPSSRPASALSVRLGAGL